MPSLVDAIDTLVEVNISLRKRRVLATPERRLSRALGDAFRQQRRAFLGLVGRLRRLVSWLAAYDEAALATTSAFHDPLDFETSVVLEASMRLTAADLDLTLTPGRSRQAAADYLTERGALRVSQITETTRGRLRTLLTQAIDEGWSTDRTARAIRQQFAEFGGARAKLIADFELSDSYEHGAMQAARDLEMTGVPLDKAWVSKRDDRVRPAHRANDNQGWIPLGQPFASGHDRPPGGPGCRCHLAVRRRPAS